MPSLIDRGNIVLLGPDLVFGSSDDVDLQLAAEDYFGDGRLFHGLNDTLNPVAFGLPTGTGECTASSEGRQVSPRERTGLLPPNVVNRVLWSFIAESERTPWVSIARVGVKRRRTAK